MKLGKLTTWLWLLTFIFILRVVGQLMVMWVDIPWLPSFNQWYSGAVAYPVLLTFQCMIIAIMTAVSIKISRGSLVPNKVTSVILLSIGSVYFVAMLIRWVIGITELLDITWFQRPIPAFFHMVLASYILLVAVYHRNGINRRA